MPDTIVGIILNNLMALAPFVIVLSYQRGVRWTLGRSPVELAPGFHWKFWLFHKIELTEITDCAIELPIQSVITKDEKLVCFSVNIGYRVADVVKHWQSVHDFDASTAALAMTHLAEKVRDRTMDDLVGDLKKLETSLRGTLTTKFRDWGTEVFSVGFTNFAEVPRQIRLFTDTQRLPGLHKPQPDHPQ